MVQAKTLNRLFIAKESILSVYKTYDDNNKDSIEVLIFSIYLQINSLFALSPN